MRLGTSAGPSQEFTTLGLGGSSSPLDEASPEALAILDGLKNPPAQTWAEKLGLLAVSLVLFVSLGLLRWSVEYLVLLVIVISVHETGHYLAMRAFGYRDVRIFFIPLFGAAVSAAQSSAQGYQRTLVALAGPVPGIIAGFALAFAYLVGGHPVAMGAATMFLALNALNLLPVLPLDGGHVLQETLFCRNRWLEVAFQAAAAAGLLLLAYFGRDWVLGLLGWVAALSVRSRFRLTGVVQRLRRSGETAKIQSASDVTLEWVSLASREVEDAFAQPLSTAAIVSAIRTIIQKLRPQPPGVWATLALLGTYGVALLLALVGAVLIAARHASGATP